MSDLSVLWSDIGITGTGVVGVVLATVVLYLLHALVIHLHGPRLMTSPSVFSVSVMALLGALTARAMLGESPTLAGGIIAMATLLVLEPVLGLLRRRLPSRFRSYAPRPTVVMVKGHLVPGLARRRGLRETQLLAMLRRSGVHRTDDAAVVILENRGTLTVVPAGSTIEPRMLEDVTGRGLIPASLLAD